MIEAIGALVGFVFFLIGLFLVFRLLWNLGTYFGRK